MRKSILRNELNQILESLEFLIRYNNNQVVNNAYMDILKHIKQISQEVNKWKN